MIPSLAFPLRFGRRSTQPFLPSSIFSAGQVSLVSSPLVWHKPFFWARHLLRLTYLVAKRLFPVPQEGERLRVRREQVARLSAWIVAAYPILLVYPLGLGRKIHFLFCSLSLSSFFFPRLRSRPLPTFYSPVSSSVLPHSHVLSFFLL